MYKLKVEEWTVSIGEVKKISKEIITELEDFLNNMWKDSILRISEKEYWWKSMIDYGIPSPIVRVDMTSLINGSCLDLIYEVEVRPAGLGILLSLFSEKTKEMREIFVSYNCKGFVNIDSSILDDRLAADKMGFPYYSNLSEISDFDSCYWVRTNKLEGELQSKLEKSSLVPIRLDGDKRYLVDLGLGKILQIDEIDWCNPFVIKPLQGARMEDVEIFLTTSLIKELGSSKGCSTRTRILNKLNSSSKKFVLQKFILPRKEEINGRLGWEIFRLYFVFKGGYRFFAGIWNWRDSLKVHGASDSIMGGVEVVL